MTWSIDQFRMGFDLVVHDFAGNLQRDRHDVAFHAGEEVFLPRLEGGGRGIRIRQLLLQLHFRTGLPLGVAFAFGAGR